MSPGRHGKVVDLSSFGEPGAQGSHMAAARYYGRITAAATARPVTGHPFSTAIRCRRRPEGRSCSGNLEVLRPDVPPEIRWWCCACGDKGVIQGWRRTSWDLAPPPRFQADESVVFMTEPLYRFIESLLSPADSTGRLVAGANLLQDGRIRLGGSLEDLHALVEVVQRWLTSETRPGRRRRLSLALAALRG